MNSDRVFTSDEDKRNRELQKLENSTGEDKSESLADMFKKTIEQLLDKSKENKGGTESASDQQEDAAGISKDAMIEAAQKTAETSGMIEKNTKDTADTLQKILGEVNLRKTEHHGIYWWRWWRWWIRSNGFTGFWRRRI
jgi:hypothetical protein